jgi:hypothetical protein
MRDQFAIAIERIGSASTGQKILRAPRPRQRPAIFLPPAIHAHHENLHGQVARCGLLVLHP